MVRPHPTLPPESRVPSPASLAWLAVKIAALRARRGWHNVAQGIQRHPQAKRQEWPRIALQRTPLRSADNEEKAMERGKIQNLRVAARALDGCLIPAGATFSFWRQVGRCTLRKGYVAGRQLQEGCLVRAVGGGICQLSNALYQVALDAGCEILERHPHTRIVPGSAAERDRDATVAWNHIDLRWRAATDMQLRVRLTPESLEVSLHALHFAPAEPKATRRPFIRTLIEPAAHACGLCEQTGCHLFEKHRDTNPGERTAFLVDEVWPEFDAYLQSERQPDDILFLPMLRGNRPAYAWTTSDWSQVRDANFQTVRRSYASRRLADQGAARQTARLAAFEALARTYARRLSPEVTHLVVSIDLLPFLWQSGHLGGRTFDVLMTRFSIEDLQSRLDRAMALSPGRKLLGDFRAPREIARAEQEALTHARRLVTPHTAFAAQDSRWWRLNWKMPSAPTWTPGNAMAFSGPTIARKGAYEVRDAALRLGVPVVRLGRDLEGDSFWEGVDARRTHPNASWLNGVAVVVQPAILEDRPRRLLEAVAAGCPVIVTEACGLAGLPGVTTIPEGDAESLIEAIRRHLPA